MNYFLITNVATLENLKWAQRYRYHLVLAQVLVQHPKYFDILCEMARDGQHRIILDNGAHEGVICTLSEYLKVCEKLRPWCVVLPDLIKESAIESRSRSLTFLDWWWRTQPSQTIMYVPQGRCQREIVDEYLWATEHFRNQIPGEDVLIGLGDGYKVCYQYPGENPEVVKTRLLQAMLDETACNELPFHVLGGRTIPTKFYSTIERVTGIDSVDPCQQALELCGSFDFTVKEVPQESALKVAIAQFCQGYGIWNDA